MDKQISYITEFLSDVYNGIYTQTTYYTDGSFSIRYIPKGKLILPIVTY